ncbi:MAG TPA: hypothetical protein VLT33_44515 [Labilithrix sp.]|nr:hypothetical protein [Labilithrix sp.]
MSGDPVRLDLSDDAPAGAIEALRLARGDAPDAARLAAIEAAVLVKIAPPSGGGGGGGSGGSSLAPMAKAGAVAIAAGAAVVAVVLATRSQPPPPVAHDTAPTASASAPAPAMPVPEPPTLSVDALPSAPEPAVVPARPAALPTASAAPDPAESERAEVALLDRAQASLPASPADTLARCDEHARRFATGTLVQEREVLAIDALLRLGRRGEAEARAARFRQSFPRSGHLRRVEALLAR